MNKNGEVVAIVPNVRCVECGSEVYIDSFATPYRGELACENCKTKMWVEGDMHAGFNVTSLYASLKELEQIWFLLEPIEQSRMTEASRCYVMAPSMCESACFDALVHILRRVYGGKHELGTYVEKLKKDPELADLHGAISYFGSIRNKVDHPVTISKPLDAESTFAMTKRLILGIARKKADKLRCKAD